MRWVSLPAGCSRPDPLGNRTLPSMRLLCERRPTIAKITCELCRSRGGPRPSGRGNPGRRPVQRHHLALAATTASEIGNDLGPPFGRGRGGPGGWWLLDEPELHFQLDVVVPDLAGWRRERLPSIPDEAALTLRPDWVCEVLSTVTELPAP